MGKAQLRVPYAVNLRIQIDVDVINIDVTLLTNLDYLDNHKLYENNTSKFLVCKDTI